MSLLFCVEESLDRVRAGLESRIASLGGRIGDLLAEYIGRPGKMLRARYALHLGGALGTPESLCERAALVVELVHNASLLHDDCIDNGLLRRGVPTPNARFGERTGIMLGDLAFVEGMIEAAGISASAVRSLMGAVSEMTVGEIQEEFIKGSPDVSFEGYCGIAARKTAAIFEWAGRVLSEASPLAHRKTDPPRLGRSAGVLLQVIDDIHDFTLNEDVAGKSPGQDFANGRLTLPSILALDDESSREGFLRAWKARASGREAYREAKDILLRGGHLDEARRRARKIMESMLPIVDALPVKEKAAELRAYIDLLFSREF